LTNVVPYALQMTHSPAAIDLFANHETLEKELTEAEYLSLTDGTATEQLYQVVDSGQIRTLAIVEASS
jgi:hypothetical protein